MSTIDINEKLEDFVRNVRNHFDEYEFSKSRIVHALSLVLILFTAFTIRLSNSLKGFDPLIKAFDPHVQVSAGEYILENGFMRFLLWFDNTSWTPYGREVGSTLYVAVPIAMVLVYLIANVLGFGITLELAAYMVPVIFGTIGVYYMYLLGKELSSERAGLISSLIMVVIPAYVSRSIAGFVDNESVGVLFTIMLFYYFSRSLSRNSNRSAVLAGLSMTLLGSSWGASRFAYDLLPLYALVLVINGKYSMRLLKTYVTTVAISSILMLTIPRLGGSFITSTEGIAPVAFIVFLVLFGMVQNLSETLTAAAFRRIILYAFVALVTILGGAFLIMLTAGLVQGIGDKFISVLLPETRNNLPLIDSVSEHLPLAWGNLYGNLSTLVFFLPLGIYFALKKPTEKNLFILTFGLVAILFSGSMVRLMLILAPAAALLTGFAVDSLLKPFALAGHGRIRLTKRTMMKKSIGGGDAWRAYGLVFVLLTIMLSTGATYAVDRYSIPELTPPADQARTQNGALTDWLDAFEWMRDNTAYTNYTAKNGFSGYEANQQPPVMLSWWDYGYYINTEGDTMTLVDNATTNSTQIGVVGTMLMYNETAALPLMYQYNIQYVLVVPAAGEPNLGSDLGKAVWMIRISEKYTKEFGIVEDDFYADTEGYKNRFYDSVLFRLMAYQSPDMDTAQAQKPPFYVDNSNLAPKLRENEVSKLDFFTEVWRSAGLDPTGIGAYQYPLIRIYKVNYPDDIDLRVNEFNLKMAGIRAGIAAEAAAAALEEESN